MNTKNKLSSRSTLFIALSIVGVGIFVAFSIAYAQQGIIPCGSSGQPNCNLCYILVLIQNLINFVVGPGGGPTTPVGIIYPLATLMVAYGGFVWFTSGGSESRLTQAKGIISSAIWGLVIALASFLIVNTVLNVLAGQGISGNVAKPPGFPWPWNQINCSVVPGGTFQPTLPTPTATTTITATCQAPLSAGARQEAMLLLGSSAYTSRKVTLDTNASCGSNFHAQQNLIDVSNGICPVVCSPNCGCQPGGPNGNVTIDPQIFLAIRLAGENSSLASFRVTSIATGSHSPNSFHYRGRAFDVVVFPSGQDARFGLTVQRWVEVRDFFKSLGYFSECEGRNSAGDTIFVPSCNSSGLTNFHIHIQF